MSEEGNLEHFLGDQFLSYWGAPQKHLDAAARAARAAMIDPRDGGTARDTVAGVQKTFRLRRGHCSGQRARRQKGSALRLAYGLVGDTVNEAARVESLTKFTA